MWTIFLALLFVRADSSSETCQRFNSTEESRLRRCLMGGSDRNARPVKMHNQTVDVDVDIVATITQMADRYNDVIMEAYVSQTWRDERLSWDPKEFGNLTSMFLSFRYIWDPELFVFSDRVRFTQGSKGRFVEQKYAMVLHSGFIEWIPQMRFTSYCEKDFSKFPYDTQTCYIPLQHEAFDNNLVKLNYRIYSCNSMHKEWELKDYTVMHKIEGWEDMETVGRNVEMKIILKREFRYHNYVFIIPSIFLALVTLSLFWITHDSNQRFAAAYSLTVVVFLLNVIIQRLLPFGIDAVPPMLSYSLYNLILLILTIIISLATNSIHNRDPLLYGIQGLIKKVLFNDIVVTAAFVSIETKTWSEQAETSGEQHSPTENTENSQQFRTNTLGPNINKTLEDISKHLGVLALPQEKITSQNEWKQLALIVDRLLFYLFFLLNIIITCVFYAG